MLPGAEQSLKSLAGYLGSEMVPRIDDAYTANMTALIAGLLLMLAHEQEHGADNFLKTNAAIRALYDSYRLRLEGAPEVERWDALRALRDSSCSMSSLRQHNHDLKTLLIEFHAWLEQSEADWADEANAAVWALLRDARRRESIEYVLDLFNSPG